MIHRSWLRFEEVERSFFPKSWCKSVDLGRADFRNAAINYVVSIGIHAIGLPGDFVNLLYAMGNINKCLFEPFLMKEDLALLPAVSGNWFSMTMEE